MSAEGKKKRGEAGKKNAMTSPFRLNGLPEDHAVRRLGVYQMRADHTGTHLVRGAIGGFLAASLGFGFSPTMRLAQLVDDSLPQAPSAANVFDSLTPPPVASLEVAEAA